MLRFDCSKDEIFKWEGRNLVPLGKKPSYLTSSDLKNLHYKLDGKKIDKPLHTWGMLYWTNADRFKTEGFLEYSEKGNIELKGAALSQLSLIKEMNSIPANQSIKVTEHFINFSHCQFNLLLQDEFKLKDVPTLKLDLFLNPNEAAIAFYDYESASPLNDNISVEYLLPTKDQIETNGARDRLSFNIPIIPSQLLDFNKSTSEFFRLPETAKNNFTLKILTFEKPERSDGPPIKSKKGRSIVMDKIKPLFRKTDDNFMVTQKIEPIDLLTYDRELECFEAIDANKLNSNHKTLLLLHPYILDQKIASKNRWANESELLNRFIDHKIFDQIVSYQHPFPATEKNENSKLLYKLIGNLQLDKTLDILSYSDKDPLASWLSSDPRNVFFKVDNILTLSKISALPQISKSNKVVKFFKSSLQAVPILEKGPKLFLRKISAENSLYLPVSIDRNLQKKKLIKKITSNILSPATSLQTVAVGWNKTLVTSTQRKILIKFFEPIIEAIIGPKHNWVVAFPEIPKECNHLNHKLEVAEMYCKNYDLSLVKENTHNIIYDYFKLKNQPKVMY